MSYVLEVQLSPETQEPLEAEARRIGLAPADFIAGIMAQRYGVARNRTASTDDGLAAEPDTMVFHAFDLETMRQKSGLPNGRTADEIADAAEAFLAGMDKETFAEMTRRGLL